MITQTGGLYIHIPYCKQACNYCDFHFSTSFKKMSEMVLALAKEIKLRQHEFENIALETIYFGGGTPSVLAVADINFLLQTIRENYKIVSNPEITLEANPDDLAHGNEQLLAYKNVGINRLSIGIQSFFESDLRLMHRAHNAQQAESCIQSAISIFENISIDLIYGVPGMTNARWLQNIEKAIAFGVPHISSYALTVEPKTALATQILNGTTEAPKDEVAEAHFDILVNKLQEASYVHYELSNFGKEGFFSKNNSNYWLGKSYIGIGPSAHSYNGSVRSWNINNNNLYINKINKGVLPKEEEILTTTNQYNEYIMTGLRTIWGVSLLKISADYGEKFETYLLHQSKRYIDQGLLVINNQILTATKKGKFLTDGIASDLFFVD
jgi:oxygen-independent coproporphyrinogen III oxidase